MIEESIDSEFDFNDDLMNESALIEFVKLRFNTPRKNFFLEF